MKFKKELCEDKDLLKEEELNEEDEFQKEFDKYVDVPLDVDKFFEIFDRMVSFDET